MGRRREKILGRFFVGLGFRRRGGFFYFGGKYGVLGEEFSFVIWSLDCGGILGGKIKCSYRFGGEFGRRIDVWILSCVCRVGR